MELKTKNGMVAEIHNYGYDWGMSFVNGGCDDAFIDTGDSAAFEDFITFLREESDLTEESINYLENNFFEDKNWHIDVESGAAEALEKNGYKKEGDYYYTLS